MTEEWELTLRLYVEYLLKLFPDIPAGKDCDHLQRTDAGLYVTGHRRKESVQRVTESLVRP